MGGKNATEVREANAAAIAHAAALLREGELVALPTETVYGLAARADSDDAVAGIYRAKGRPSFNPLIVHVANLEQAKRLAQFSEDAQAAADAAWPGALTLVLPLRKDAGIAPAVTAGLDTIALRCPAHPVMRAMLEQCGLPLAAPSANRSNALSPPSAAHVLGSLGGRIALVLDGGESAQGIESSILAIRGNGDWQELRPGPVDIAALHRQVLGKEWEPPERSVMIEAPGQLERHYSPGKPLRLGAIRAQQDEFHIGFADIPGDVTLSADADLAEAASRLYSALHAAAASAKPRIAVAPIPGGGIGTAINDRLRRAAR